MPFRAFPAQRRRSLAAMSLAATIAFATPAYANGTLAAQYFVLPAHHPDVDHGVDEVIVKGLVANRLGANGLPVVTRLGRTYSGPSGPIHDVDAAGELLWYGNASPGGARRVKTGIATLPLQFDPFYPPGKKADGEGNGYVTAHFSGSFTLPKMQSVGLTLGSDDDSWVFIDGRLVVDNGGVKPVAQAPFTIAKLAAGIHRLDVFYADRHGAGAALQFSTAFAVTPPRSSAPSVPKRAASLAAQIRHTGHVAVYGIHFAFDKATIASDSAGVLADVASVLRADPALRLRIEGHTDGSGDAAYNRALSGERADAVKAYLVEKSGIAASRLTTRGFGPDRPVATNATAAGRAKNRRVELVRQ